jgi:hypothetical protein
VLIVETGYVSGTPLSDTTIYFNQTFNTLGVTPGTYVWTWASDSFTLRILAYAGTPGFSNCHGVSTSALSIQYGGDLSAAAKALGFPSVQALQNSIRSFCGG